MDKSSINFLPKNSGWTGSPRAMQAKPSENELPVRLASEGTIKVHIAGKLAEKKK
jgi:hypothetical protein